MVSDSRALCAYIIASHRLAGEYLFRIIAKDRRLKPVLCEQLPLMRPNQISGVFVFDTSNTSTPLSVSLRKLRSMAKGGRFLVVDNGQPDVEIIRLLSIGIHGFVTYSDVRRTLCDAITKIAAGGLWIPHRILQLYVESAPHHEKHGADTLFVTTPRETEVLELVRQRLSNKEIGEILGVRESTVKYHLSNILGKFQASSRGELRQCTNGPRFF